LLLALAILLLLAGLGWLMSARPWESGKSAAATTVATTPLYLQLYLQPSPGQATDLTRYGLGPGGSQVRVLWATPEYFRATNQSDLAAQYGVEKNLVFLIWEDIHDQDLVEPLLPLLRVGGSAAYAPSQVIAPEYAVHHRQSVALYSLYDSQGLPILDERSPFVQLILPPANEEGAQSILSWAVPESSSKVPSLATVNESKLQVSDLSRLLTKSYSDMEYQGAKGIRIEATYATSDYFTSGFPGEAAARFLPDRYTVFAVSETLHTATLPGAPPAVSLRLDGREYKSDLAEQITASPHHRVTLVRFPVEPPTGLSHRVMELLLPGDAGLTWHLPISYAGLEASSGFGVTWVSILAVLGGLVAAMWPCLFQLTVFFIPALAGLSTQEAGSSVTLGRRATVVKAGLFFVLGFTLVYTVAGAVIGFAAGRLGDTSGFYVWQRYLGIVGGAVIILLALRVAAKVRAPLVCKMPVLSHLSRRRRPANPAEMMVAGLAFATGCMTCFGAALVVAMVAYVGLSGSALVGAFTLFLFSMGMGIPLVIGSIAMARVLPLLSRFEKAIRWMGLASSLIMVGFAGLLITGNYMVLTEWVYRLLPAPGIR
jgi:cytochrome c biogenesis protein CcdA